MTETLSEFEGQVFWPGTEKYQQALVIDNGRIRGQPAMVLLPENRTDILRGVKFAAERGMSLSIRSGGHSGEGYSILGDVVLDMSGLRRATFNPNTTHLSVQGGALWEDVYRACLTAGTSRTPIGGGCVSVGVAGFILGGGYSFVSRSYGLGCDSLVSFRMIAPTGEELVADPQSTDPDIRELFWASCGGGGGNFGVVTDLELRTHAVSTEAMQFIELRYPAERLEEALRAYSTWVASAPDSIAGYGLWRLRKVGGRRLAHDFGFTIIHNGHNQAVDAVVATLTAVPGVSVERQSKPLPEYELQRGYQTVVHGRRAFIKCGMLGSTAWAPQLVERLKRHMSVAPTPECFLVWTHAGGMIGRKDARAAAFPHRDAGFVLQLKAIYDDPVAEEQCQAWADRFFDDLAPFLSGAYVNYIDSRCPGWRSAYYGDRYERLAAVKRRWDPSNLLRFPQGLSATN